MQAVADFARVRSRYLIGTVRKRTRPTVAGYLLRRRPRGATTLLGLPLGNRCSWMLATRALSMPNVSPPSRNSRASSKSIVSSPRTILLITLALCRSCSQDSDPECF